MRSLLLLALTTSAFAQVGPNYERPATAAPPKFKGVTWRAATPSAHLPKGEWWKVFNDPTLDSLVGTQLGDVEAPFLAQAYTRNAEVAAAGDLQISAVSAPAPPRMTTTPIPAMRRGDTGFHCRW